MEKVVTEKEFDKYTAQIIAGLVGVLTDDEDFEGLMVLPAVAAAALKVMKIRIFGETEEKEDEDDADGKSDARPIKHIVETDRSRIIVCGPKDKELPDWLYEIVDEIAAHAGNGKKS